MNTINLSQLSFHFPSPAQSAAAASVATSEAADDEQTPPATSTSSESSTVVRISMESLRLMRQEAEAPAKEKNEALELYGKYEHRLNHYMRSFFTQDDKELLGEAYKMADEKGRDLKKIDKLANELGVRRFQQYMAGDLVLSATGQERDENAPRQPDLAHMAILGEMRKMAG
ncbi:hypothetical protein AGMMS50256_28740 [Betaproteobacteria bacterium]|nr:hypothetical protein AGMMS50256_28740 [Betaproteobacteria bacterium]